MPEASKTQLPKSPALLQYHSFRENVNPINDHHNRIDNMRTRFQTANHEGPGSDLQDDGVLCTDCASYGIAEIFSNIENSSKTKVIFELRNEHLRLEKSPCPLCDIIIWMVQGMPASVRRDKYIFMGVRTSFLGRNGMYDLECLQLTLCTRDGLSHISTGLGPRFVAITKSQRLLRLNPMMRSRQLQPVEILELVDYERMKRWLRSCDQLFGHKACKPCKVRRKWPTKLLDCQSLKIVKAQPSSTYVALSYVWGQPQDNSFSLQDAPATIRDAVEVTLNIGYRYLWVDRYCIDQNHSAERDTEIQQMSRIYNGASLTVIAAAGSDPDYGLPGVSKPRKQRPPAKTISGWSMTGFPDNPCELIQSSVWISRAWTYQESLLSKRRLYFTDQVLYFECQSIAYEESFADSNSTCARFTSINGQSLAVYPHEIFRYISNYSERQLTYESDYLNAFLGILGYMAETNPALYHLSGVPIFPPVRYDRHKKGSYTRIDRSYDGGLMIGMTWKVKDGERRRGLDLPSWSWVGWKGTIGWPCSPRDLIEMRSNNKAWIENAAGELLSLQDLYERPDSPIGDYNLCKVIHIESTVFEVELAHIDQGSFAYRGVIDSKHNLRVEMVSGHYAAWNHSSGARVYAQVDVYGAIQQPGNFKILILGRLDGFYASTPGKLLREIPGGYEVVGHIDNTIPAKLFVSSLPVFEGKYNNQMLLPDMVKEQVRLL
ncbi:HET-domain-containing protein [Hypoxylon sp. FL1857]|nr:HET-domain-containing protein [Hypoxylon sp. FL1857]